MKITYLIFGLLLSVLTNSCNKDKSTVISNPVLTYGTMSDQDGNNYKTIQIGTQNWMAENLIATKYNDGTPIPDITDSASWLALTSGAYCWYNDDASYKNTYGALYNWYSVNSGKLCPIGWHVPSKDEWTILFTYLGGDSLAGSKLKEPGHWPWDKFADNSSGFTAIPAGWRSGSGNFTNSGAGIANWWSSTGLGASAAWNCLLAPTVKWGVTMIWFDDMKQYGYSVRCIRD